MKLEEGRTQDYLIHAFFIGLGGLALIYLSLVNEFNGEPLFNNFQILLAFFSGSVIVLFSFFLARAKSGVEIDIESQTIRVYKTFLGRTFGRWYSLFGIVSAELKLTYESQQMMSRGGERSYTTRTFDLYLINSAGQSSLFHNFTRQSIARDILKSLNDNFKIPIKDFT